MRVIRWWEENENGEIHWVVSDGIETVRCDDGELSETIEELRDNAS